MLVKTENLCYNIMIQKSNAGGFYGAYGKKHKSTVFIDDL